MKYLLMAVLAGLFFINPAFAEREINDDKRGERRERENDDNERGERRERNQWKILKNISAAERKKLRKLHSENPAVFRKEIAKIVKRVREQREKKEQLNQKIKKLAIQYKKAKDEETKKEAMEQLRKITKKTFMGKMQKNKKRLESLEKHVKKLRQQYEFRQKNADKIIQSRLNSLTEDKNFDW